MKVGEFPELRIKAYAGRLLLAHLQHVVAELVEEIRMNVGRVDDDILLVNAVLTELSQWFIRIERCGRYLSQDDANHIWETHLRCLAGNSFAID